jgi:mannose-6-phosphate isomerase-like protein (cupin superfamily)
LGPGGGSTISALGSTYTTKTDGEATGGAYSLVEEELWGDPTPLHVHTRNEEAFYVLSGRLAVWVNGTETVAEPGSFLVIPRGVPHAVRPIGDDPPRMLTLVSPAGLQLFFEAVVRERAKRNSSASPTDQLRSRSSLARRFLVIIPARESDQRPSTAPHFVIFGSRNGLPGRLPALVGGMVDMPAASLISVDLTEGHHTGFGSYGQRARRRRRPPLPLR